jgi:hypothetical protein
MSLSAPSRSHYLAVVTLLDQLDPNESIWKQLGVILEGRSPFLFGFLGLVIFDSTKSNIEFSQIVSKFLMDQNRAGYFWVHLKTYMDLATQLLSILHDK